jgi:hypothetical protein
MEKLIVACELRGVRVSIYRDEYNYFVINTATEKVATCLCFEQAVDLFDHCIAMEFGSLL